MNSTFLERRLSKLPVNIVALATLLQAAAFKFKICSTWPQGTQCTCPNMAVRVPYADHLRSCSGHSVCLCRPPITICDSDFQTLCFAANSKRRLQEVQTNEEGPELLDTPVSGLRRFSFVLREILKCRIWRNVSGPEPRSSGASSLTHPWAGPLV